MKWSKLAKKFEGKLHVVSDPVLDTYLTKVTNRLILASADPRLAGTGIQLIQSRNVVWRSYSLPGRRVYLSAQLLQKVRSDNEVAALIAVELAHIQQRQVLDHLKLVTNPTPGSASSMEKPAELEILIFLVLMACSVIAPKKWTLPTRARSIFSIRQDLIHGVWLQPGRRNENMQTTLFTQWRYWMI